MYEWQPYSRKMSLINYSPFNNLYFSSISAIYIYFILYTLFIEIFCMRGNPCQAKLSYKNKHFTLTEDYS